MDIIKLRIGGKVLRIGIKLSLTHAKSVFFTFSYTDK